jgi:hypothetical protein
MAVSAAAAGPSGMASRQSLSFVIGASSVGTLIERYDFYLYDVRSAIWPINAAGACAPGGRRSTLRKQPGAGGDVS